MKKLGHFNTYTIPWHFYSYLDKLNLSMLCNMPNVAMSSNYRKSYYIFWKLPMTMNVSIKDWCSVTFIISRVPGYFYSTMVWRVVSWLYSLIIDYWWWYYWSTIGFSSPIYFCLILWHWSRLINDNYLHNDIVVYLY